MVKHHRMQSPRQATSSKERPDRGLAPTCAWHDCDQAIGLTAALLIGLIWMQVLVGLSPEVYWDVVPTPGQSLSAVTVMGPAGLAWLNSLMLIVSSAAMAIHVRRAGRVAWWAVGLTLMGVLVVAGHVCLLGNEGWRGGAWIASAVTALSLYHLAQHALVRRLAVAVSLGAIVPLTLVNLWYVLMDHPQTVRFYLEHEAQALIDRAWQAGSPQHLAYRRRLMSPDAIGFVGLSNLQGAMLAALAAMAMGQLIGRWPSGWKNRRWALFLLAVALLGAVLTRSRGALAALALATLAVMILTWWRPLAKYPRRFSMTALLLVLSAVVAVVGRGLMGPPSTAAGERSLLFRFHYWQAACRMFRDGDIGRWLFGVGPGNFKELYAFYKPSLNPEEVLSTHNVAVDFVTMLGVGGLAWVLLLLGWLWQSGRMGPVKPPIQADPSSTSARTGWMLGVAVVPATLASYWIRLPEMWWGSALFWLTAAAGMGWVACFTMKKSQSVSDAPRAIDLPMYGGALVLLVHGQIEMVFFQPGVCAVAWMMVALAASSCGFVTVCRGIRWAWLLPLLISGLAAASVVGAIGVTNQQRKLRDAAVAMSQGNPSAAVVLLERAAEMFPADVTIYRQAAELRFSMAAAAHQRNDLREWNRQLALIGQWVDRARADGVHHSSLERLAAQTFDWQASQGGMGSEGGGERGGARQAMEMWTEIAARRPHDFSVWLSLAQACERVGESSKAAAAYRRALDISQQSYLDPLMQLSSQQEQAIRRAISRLESPGNKNARE